MTRDDGRPTFPSNERWNLLEHRLDELLRSPTDQRATMLEDVDVGLRHELGQMLVACDRIDRDQYSFQQPAAERFAKLFDESDNLSRLAEAVADRYVLECEAGRGGMAIVYRAHDVRHARPVAFKAMRTALSESASARFRREIALVAALQHPHIVPVFDSGDSDDRLWYTMPFVEGETLGARLRRSGALEIHEVVRIVREIADGLDYAHARGVIHRDLKPDNVLLSQGHAVIADFGVAKALAAAAVDDPASSIVPLAAGDTAHGARVGTPAYMAPEQIAGTGALDHRADLYALGVIAFELLTGEPPFGRDSSQLVSTEHVAHVAAPVSSRRPDVPPALDRLIACLLENAPDDRPRSGAEVIAALDALQAQRGVSDSGAKVIRRRTHRAYRWIAGSVVVVAAVALAVSFVALWPSFRWAVISRLDPRLTHWAMGARPASPAAQTAFTNGLDLMSEGDPERAIESWMRAAALDSTYMQPRLHAAATLQGLQGFAPVLAESVLAPVIRRRALLAPGDRAMLDYDLGAIRGDPAAVFSAGEAFVRAEPDADLPYFFMEIAAMIVSRPERAIEAATHIDTAGRFRLAGASALHLAVVTQAYHQLGQFADELKQARAGRALNPTSVAMVALEARALAGLDSVAALRRVIGEIAVAATPKAGPSTTSMLLDVAGEIQYHRAGREAVDVVTRALNAACAREAAPTSDALLFDHARCLYWIGRYHDAEPLFEKLARAPVTEMHHPLYLSYYGATAARLGRISLVDSIARQLDSPPWRYDRGMTPYAQAQFAAQRGDTAAMSFLFRAFQSGATIMGISLHADGLLAPLRDDPRFEDLARRGVGALEQRGRGAVPHAQTSNAKN